jgi:thymidylate kinase
MLKEYKIPEIYKLPLRIFKKSKINYILFKQTEKHNTPIGGLDILFQNNKDYKQAIKMLQKNKYQIYLTEKNEPFKTMMVKYEKDFMIILHLHRRIAWLGIKTLNQKKVVRRAKRLNTSVKIPSKEDQALIHAAHILFENRKMTPTEKKIFKNKNLDYKYINSQLERHGWKQNFYKLIKKQKLTLPIKPILNIKTQILLTKQLIQFVTKRISPKRKGALIALVGPNGSGKSTLAKESVKTYNKLFDKLKLKANYFYFGWKPILPTTKLLQKIPKKELYKTATTEKIPKFSLKYELFFTYLFIEYLITYLTKIYPKLRNRELVICDRYFYHVYGQYPYSENSIIMNLLLKLFPKPDQTLIINTNIETLTKRRKTIGTQNLKDQLRRYKQLSKIPNSQLMNSGTLRQNLETLNNKIWKKHFRRLKY